MSKLIRMLGAMMVVGVAFSAIGLSHCLPAGGSPLETPATTVVPEYPVPISLDPRVTVRDANAAQLARLAVALERFSQAELALPDLEVEFYPDRDICGAHGWFSDDEWPWRIQICSDIHAVYEHELAHAWERANLDDLTRRAFMDLRGYTHWNGRDVPWNQKGVEGVAFIIQQGLSGLHLPPRLGSEWESRLEAFELLTARPAPNLVDWVAAREVPCDQRPTSGSLRLADASGTVCDGITLSSR